jgi:hypothetical protein
MAVALEQNVLAGLGEVAVDDAPRVHVRERRRQLPQHRARVGLGEPLARAALALEQGAEVALRTELHQDVQLARCW